MLIVVVGLVCLILGIFLGRLHQRYIGVINITENGEGGKLYSLDLDVDPEDLDLRGSVLFKIQQKTEEVQ